MLDALKAKARERENKLMKCEIKEDQSNQIGHIKSKDKRDLKHFIEKHKNESSIISKLLEEFVNRPDEADVAEQPFGLTVTLMEHQLIALAWMKWREKSIVKGGLLLDDMGLGVFLHFV